MKNVETSNSPRLLDVAEVAEPLNKQSALEATQQNEHEGTKARDDSTQESSALQQQRPIDHRRFPYRKVGHLLRFDFDEVVEWTKDNEK